MTVSGVLSGLIDPRGAGHALSRAAARIDASTPPADDSVRTVDSPETASFDVEDVVELSSAVVGGELTPDEQAQVEQLKQRDAEVRQHEAAHAATAGPYARGGAQFEYQTGPDGRRYAVGGEVQIDTSTVPDNPRATIAKMEQIRAAALAPADPSSQDQRIAAQAAAEIQKARAEQAASSEDDQEGERGRTSEAAATEGFGALQTGSAVVYNERAQTQGRFDRADRTDRSDRNDRSARRSAAGRLDEAPRFARSQDPRFVRDRHPAPALVDTYA